MNFTSLQFTKGTMRARKKTGRENGKESADTYIPRGRDRKTEWEEVRKSEREREREAETLKSKKLAERDLGRDSVANRERRGREKLK